MRNKDLTIKQTCKVVQTSLEALAGSVRHMSKVVELKAFSVWACDVSGFEEDLAPGYEKHVDEHQTFHVFTYNWSYHPNEVCVKLFVPKEELDEEYNASRQHALQRENAKA